MNNDLAYKKVENEEESKSKFNKYITNKKLYKLFKIIITFIIIILVIIRIDLIIQNIRVSLKIKNRKQSIIDFSYTKKERKLNLNGEVKKIKVLYKDQIINPKNLKEVHISLALNNNFIYQTLVSMSSALANNNIKKTFLVYHLLITSDFSEKNIDKIYMFKKQYPHNLAINFYDMSDTFKNQKKWHGTVAAYYRILLPELLPNLDRIIYMDGDTLILTDLQELYYLPFHNNYILGKPTTFEKNLLAFGVEAHMYLNSGVLLFNLEKIRNDNKTIEILNFLYKKSSSLKFPDQDAMNFIFYPNIGLLPYKYGIMCYHNRDNLINVFAPNVKFNPDLKELVQANINPGVIHYVNCHPKIWSKNTKFYINKYLSNICHKYHKLFYYYAKKTKYYKEIYNSLIDSN